MKKFCPECGFELQEGDVFCMNCGASLDEEEKPTEQNEKPKKKFNPVPLIIIGGIIVVLAVAALIVFNSPQATLIRSCYKLSKEINENKTLQRVEKILNEGSVELSAEIEDIAADFKIPLISQIDASASAKYYMNQKEAKSMLKLTGSLGGTTALGADFWFSPTELVVRSNTLLGKKAYGIDLEDTTSRDEAKRLLNEYLGIDADGYDNYLKLVQAYTDKEDVLNEKLVKQLVIELIKNAKWDKEKDEIEINDDDVDVTIVYMSVDKERIEKITNSLYNFAKKDEDFEDVMEYIDRDEIEDAIDNLDDNFKIRYKYYIDKDMNLIRQDTKIGDISTRLERFPEEKGFELEYEGDFDVTIRYDVEQNDDERYESTLSANDIDVNIVWNKNTEKWRIDGGLDLVLTGTMEVDEDEITGVIGKINAFGQSISPNLDFKIRNEDKMPELPSYKSIKDVSDVEEIVNAVKESIMGAIEKFLPKPEPIPEPEVEATPDTKADTEAEAVPEDTRKTIPVDGTYIFDDGNEFSIDFQTGAVQQHLQCTAVLKPDGTYTLAFSNGMMSYDDTGTYKRFEDNTMEFKSNSGINATGKYKTNSIEVTIAGFGTVELPKKK